MSQLDDCRKFFSELITANAGIAARGSRVALAFAETARERFVGKGPWKVFTPVGYVETPGDDPVLLYQDITVSLRAEGAINNGQPSLHAVSLAALDVKLGETAIHVGAGTGYYTALLARLVGPGGSVMAFEVERDLALLATRNLSDMAHVEVQDRSGAAGPLPPCDVIYVNAGATGPLDVWLDALRPGGRLLFPLTPAQGVGGMLLVTRTSAHVYDARFTSPAMFIPCVGARDDQTAKKLATAFSTPEWRQVRSLRRGTSPDESCWFAGNGWWLSKEAQR